MKKVIICNIPMKKDVDQTVYVSNDKSLPVTDRPVRYSINALLEETLKPEDDVKVLMLAKKDEYSCYEQNMQYFIDELNEYIYYYKIVKLLSLVANEKEQLLPPYTEEALHYIKDNYREKISVENIAAQVQLSFLFRPSHVTR